MTPVNAAAWYRVSSGHQDSDNQVPEVEAFSKHHGYQVTASYTVTDTAWKGGGGPEYKATLAKALDDAHAGKFSVLVVWSLDRIVRAGAEEALKVLRQFRQRGCTWTRPRRELCDQFGSHWWTKPEGDATCKDCGCVRTQVPGGYRYRHPKGAVRLTDSYGKPLAKAAALGR